MKEELFRFITKDMDLEDILRSLPCAFFTRSEIMDELIYFKGRSELELKVNGNPVFAIETALSKDPKARFFIIGGTQEQAVYHPINTIEDIINIPNYIKHLKIRFVY